MKLKESTICWRDIHVYRDGKKHEPTLMVTQGNIIKNTESFIIVKNPRTRELKTDKNHPNYSVKFYYIPQSLILKINGIKK